MNIKEFKEYCKNNGLFTMTKIRFTDTFSSRACYSDLGVSFELDGEENGTTLLDNLNVLENAIGETYEGYKGGEFEMDLYSEIWLCKDESSYECELNDLIMDLSLVK